MKFSPAAFLVAGLVSLPVSLQAGIVRTLEAVGVQSSSQTTVITEEFNNLTPGSYPVINSLIGTYTSSAPGAAVVSANAFGGSDQTNYLAVGAQSSPTTTVSLALFTPANYFGLYWGAGDALNVLKFFYQGNEVGSFTTADIFAGSSNAYFGNPNTGQNTGEKYAYVNFLADANGTIFDRIDFINNGTGTGFETDNHSVNAVPEPSTLVSLGMGGGSLAVAAFVRRRRKARTA